MCVHSFVQWSDRNQHNYNPFRETTSSRFALSLSPAPHSIISFCLDCCTACYSIYNLYIQKMDWNWPPALTAYFFPAINTNGDVFLLAYNITHFLLPLVHVYHLTVTVIKTFYSRHRNHFGNNWICLVITDNRLCDIYVIVSATVPSLLPTNRGAGDSLRWCCGRLWSIKIMNCEHCNAIDYCNAERK